ncbi:MAG TPA: RDD family protein [Puia sp.]|nr:RDD family protein [Puia sp.]
MNEIQQDILNDFIEPAKPANIGKRIGAAIIDGILLCIIFVIVGNLFGEPYKTTTTSTVTTSSDQGSPTTTREITTSRGYNLGTTGTLIYLCGWFLLLPVIEGQGGQTIGKKALGIKVIRQNGEPVNIGISFVRHFFDFIDCFFLIGLIVASSNPLHKRIADNIAGTYVVEKA